MNKKKWAYISLEVVFLLTIVVISGMYGTIKLFKHGQEAADQQNTAFEKVRSTLAIGEGGLGGGGIPILPDEPGGVSDTIYWGVDSTGKLIISDEEVTTATGGKSGSFSGTDVFANELYIPWYSYRSSIKYVEVTKIHKKVSPVSTYMWFYGLYRVRNIDVTNLDVSNATDMSLMFMDVGSNITDTFTITGLENWNTSNVTNTKHMFQHTASNATNWSIGDLSNWDVSNVTNMGAMFYGTASAANTFDIGDLSKWDTSSAVDMQNMFYGAGLNATYYLDLSSWDVRNIEIYVNFNHSVEDKIDAPVFSEA